MTDEFFIGCLALMVATIAIAIALGPWTRPYRIGSVARVENRFGKPAARSVWLIVAIIAAASGSAILTGLRPGYAAPTNQEEMPQ